MIVKYQDSYLELHMAEQMPLDVQGAGDTLFVVKVRVSGYETVFSAESRAWVEAPVLVAFTRQLRDLEKRRQGSAVLESMAPGELRLEVRSYGRVGRVGAFGQLGHWCQSEADGRYWSVVSFGFPYCPTELPGIIREFEELSRPTATE